VVRYGIMRNIGLFSHDLPSPPPPGAKVVVRTERGAELGQVVTCVQGECGYGCITPEGLEQFIGRNGPEYPFIRHGRVLRMANSQDLIDQRHLDSSAHEEMAYCRQEIRAMNLPMKVVTVEHLLGGERIVFYFASENRVDFRELVRRLAWQYRTRIEMRQVGARDEARLVGDLERCGRPCCCQRFLKDLKPVSMRMAKVQKATLDPSKISGRCGRLMCCLRYEDEGYEELRKKLPRKNTYVRTAAGVVGRVMDTQILTQWVRLAMADNTQTVVSNEEIVERDLPAPATTTPSEAPPVEARQNHRPPYRQANHLRPSDEPEVQAAQAEEQTPVELPDEQAMEDSPRSQKPQAEPAPSTSDSRGESDGSRHRRRKGQRRHHPVGGSGAPPGNPQATPETPPRPQANPGNPGQGGGGRGRRRRRRR
jgi:cell fate regulator YaaT (PSP1 superfamily)